MLDAVREQAARVCRVLVAWVLVLVIVALVQELLRLIEDDRGRRRRDPAARAEHVRS